MLVARDTSSETPDEDDAREASAAIKLPRAGDTFGDKYTIVRLLGEGGMGAVFEATHNKLMLPVAIKMLLPRLVTAPGIVARFEREGRAAARLASPHVARILDVDLTPDGLPFIVMELLQGIDLDIELANRGPLPIPEAVDYVLQACEAMHEAHGLGIVHRDLKPANMFLCAGSGERRAVKVLDFGISKTLDAGERRLTATETTVGTPLYMSPEQIRGAKDLDARSDVWSLGVILYELLAATTPFTGSTTAAAVAIATEPAPSLREKRPEVPAALEEAVMRALEKSPAKRFQDVDAFACAISPFSPLPAQAEAQWSEEARSGPRPLARIVPRSDAALVSRTTAPERPPAIPDRPAGVHRPPARRLPALAALAALTLSLLGAGGVKAWQVQRRSPPTASPHAGAPERAQEVAGFVGPPALAIEEGPPLLEVGPPPVTRGAAAPAPQPARGPEPPKADAELRARGRATSSVPRPGGAEPVRRSDARGLEHPLYLP